MNVELTDPRVLEGLPWVDLKSYLDAQGWQHIENIGDRALVYRPGENGAAMAADHAWAGPEILVPAREDVADYAARMADALQSLSSVEQRPMMAVYQDLIAAGNDVIRLRVSGADASGSIPIAQGVVLYRETENLLLAAASSVEDARSSYHTRKITQATEYLKTVRLGQTERGSYVLRALSPVQPVIGRQREFDMNQQPFARAVSLRLSQGLAAARQAANRAVVMDDFAPFIEAVDAGVSANLCDAIAHLAKLDGGIAIDISWARTRPSGQPLQRFRFSQEMAEVLSEAATQFRQSEPETDARITGFVTALERPLEDFDGNARLHGLINNKLRRLRVRVDQVDYHKVIKAFQDKLAVSLIGDLYPSGQRLEIRNARQVRVLEDQDPDDNES